MTGGPGGGAGRPLLVAHRGGNDLARARASARAGADLVELDLHLRRGRLEVRHPRRIGPVLWDGEGVALARAGLRLDAALAAIPAEAEPMVDLKGGSGRLGPAALAALREARGEAPATVSARRWTLLEPLAGSPGLRLVHSAASPRELAGVRALVARGECRVACLRRDLLHEGLVAGLAEAGARVWTWPVRDAGEAARLAGWGVGALICDDLALIGALSGRGAPS